jgi:hypothetical protein
MCGALLAASGCGRPGAAGPAPAANTTAEEASHSIAPAPTPVLPTSYKPASGKLAVRLETDPSRVIEKMLYAYRTAWTIQDRSEARMFVGLNGGIFIQQNSFKFKKPSLLTVTSEDPRQGTLSCYHNGLTVTLYLGKQNVYTKVSSPKDLDKVMNLVDSAVPQVLSPASFLVGHGGLREADHFKLVGRKTVAGHDTYVIQASARPDFLRWLTRSADPVLQHRSLTLYVDTSSNLLVRGACDVSWLARVRTARGQVQQVLQGFRFQEDHVTSVLNEPVPDSDFYFTPPKNAAEVFREQH